MNNLPGEIPLETCIAYSPTKAIPLCHCNKVVLLKKAHEQSKINLFNEV